jgi:hypothetical protein
MVARLARGSMTTPEIGRHFGFSRQALNRHVGILEDAGLIRRTLKAECTRWHWCAARSTKWPSGCRAFDEAGKAISTQGSPRPAAAVSGTRIYVPANSAVVFTLTSAVPTQTAQGQPAAGTAPGVAQPRQPGVQPAAAGAPAATTSNTVVYYQIQYQLTGCQRQAPHIICNITVTNQRGGDIMLNGAGGAYYIDQSGNRVNADMRSLANCVGWGACQLVPNIAMAGQWQFMDQDNHATQLVRLQIHENGVPVAQFNSVPIN